LFKNGLIEHIGCKAGAMALITWDALGLKFHDRNTLDRNTLVYFFLTE
jgi:hypothetical protein